MCKAAFTGMTIVTVVIQIGRLIEFDDVRSETIRSRSEDKFRKAPTIPMMIKMIEILQEI